MVIGHSMQMRRVKVKETDVILPFAILMTANIAVLLAWTIVDPLKWVRTEPDDQNQSHGFCQADDQTAYKFLIPIGVINALALILANLEPRKNPVWEKIRFGSGQKKIEIRARPPTNGSLEALIARQS